MEFLRYLYIVIGGCLIFFLVFPFLKVLFSFFKNEKIGRQQPSKTFDFGCVITAYRNVDIAKGLVQSLLNQRYDNFAVYLVADVCDVSSWGIRHEKLALLLPKVPLRLKAKSIIHATENFKREHEYVVVFDADNLAHPDFLKEINRYANEGHQCIQGQRTAKNLDTVYACADATGEFYKIYVERYVPYLLGSSSVISGSGMAVESTLYSSYLRSPEIAFGKELWKAMLQEDKILQNFILRQNKRIVYAWNAVVYDEKVTSANAVKTQRGRWLFSYFQNMGNALGILRRGLLKGSFNQILFGAITIAPPLFIMAGLSVATAISGLFFMPAMSLALFFALLVFSANVLLTLHLSRAPRQIWQSLWGIPLFVWNQITALLKMGNPNKNFKHTEHHQGITVEEVMRMEKTSRPTIE